MQQRPADLRLAPIALLWLALLLAASVAFSLGFACALPLAAFAAVAALTLSRRNAWLAIGAVWLVNQALGFGGAYPWTASTFAWGAVLGVVSVLGTLAAQAIASRVAGMTAFGAAFLAAFAAYEGGLFLTAATLLGGTADYSVAIVTRVFEINAAAFIGLLALHRLLASRSAVVARPA